jgi:hypothetical protein
MSNMRVVVVVTVLSWCLAAAALRGDSIPPGGSVLLDDAAALPTGPRLAQKVQPFTLNFARPGDEGVSPDPVADGILTSSVYRNPDTGALTFVYDIDVEREFQTTDEASRLTLGSFAGFLTNVEGDFGELSSGFTASRSADGATVVGQTSLGQGGPPLLIIRTDATAFDESGTANYFAAAEFVIGGDQVERTAEANFAGTYRPVPEPGAAAALAGIALLLCRRWRLEVRSPGRGPEGGSAPSPASR